MPIIKARIPGASSPNARVSTSNTFGTYNDYAGSLVADSVYSFDLNDLDANTEYFYKFEDGGLLSNGYARLKTKPANGTASFIFGVGSCAGSVPDYPGPTSATSNAPTFTRIQDRAEAGNMLFFWHTGDLHYYNLEVADVSQYRSAYQNVMANANQAACWANTPIVYSWDDHDYGANNSDSTNVGKAEVQQAYREYVPHPTLPDSAGIYHTFVVGRVRFIILDGRSYKSPNTDTDNSSKTMLGTTQKTWFKNTLLAATEPLIFVGVNVAWIGTAAPNDDEWFSYSTERQELAEFFEDNNLTNRLYLIHGDAHMLAMDDGTNTQYDSGSSNDGPPLFCAAPLDNANSIKGGPYSEGTYTTSKQQYGTVEISDSGTSITVTARGWDVDGASETNVMTLVSTFASTQDIAPNVISSGTTFYSPSVAVGGITVSPDAIASTTTFFNPVVTPGAISIAPNLITSGETFYSPFVSLGAINISVDAITSGETHYAPEIIPGAINIDTNVVSSTETHYQPSVVVGSINIDANRIESEETHYRPTVTFGAVDITPNVITSTETHYQPQVSVDATIIAPNFLASTGQLIHEYSVVGGGSQLKFFGNGENQIDRVRIDQDGTAINVGDSDFTYEFWIRCNYADNTTDVDDARYMNVVLDHDVWGNGQGAWKFGVTRDASDLVMLFGYGPNAWQSFQGFTNIGDGEEHHIALVRIRSTGRVYIYVDGVLDNSQLFGTADWSIAPGTDDSGGGQDNKYLVIGAEKHDYYDTGNGAYNGFFDSLRISDTARYTGSFTPDRAPVVDIDTVGLYLLDEMSGTTIYDTTGSGPTGALLVGGTPSGPEWFPTFGPDQTITPNLITSGETHYSPEVVPGAIDVTPNLISSTAQVFDIAIVPDQEITPNVITSTAQVFEPGLTFGAIDVTADAISSTETHYQPSVDVGAANIDANPVASESQVFDPGLTFGTVNVDVNFLASTSQIYNPSVEVGTTNVSASFIASTEQIFEPEITFGLISIDADVIDSVVQFFEPTFTFEAINIDADVLTNTSTIYDLLVEVGVANINANVIDSTLLVYEPTLTFGSINVSPDVIGSTSTIYSPTVYLASDQNISLNILASTLAFYNMIVSGSITPSERTYNIPAENRVVSIPAENRVVNIS